jgi:hypothetical protein
MAIKQFSSCSNEGVDNPVSDSILGRWKTLKNHRLKEQICHYRNAVIINYFNFKDGSPTLLDPVKI